MARNRATRGDWNIIDDDSGFKVKASDVRLRWDGVYVTKESYEERHPQDFIRMPKEDQSVPFVRAEAVDTFKDVTFADTSTDDPDSTGTFDGSL